MTINHVKMGADSILEDSCTSNLAETIGNIQHNSSKQTKKLCAIYQKSYISSNEKCHHPAKGQTCILYVSCKFLASGPLRMFPSKVAIYCTLAPRDVVSDRHNQSLCLSSSKWHCHVARRCLQWPRPGAANYFLLESQLWPFQSNCNLESPSINSVIKQMLILY
jgi:hypothetical protein